jgi:hypothetical protein
MAELFSLMEYHIENTFTVKPHYFSSHYLGTCNNSDTFLTHYDLDEHIATINKNILNEQNKRRIKTKISLLFKHGLNNTKYVGYLKCLRLMSKLIFLHCMTSEFILQYEI